MIISTKLFLILTTGFRTEDFKSFCYPAMPCPLVAMFFDVAIFVEGHLRNIPMKFGEDCPSGIGVII